MAAAFAAVAWRQFRTPAIVTAADRPDPALMILPALPRLAADDMVLKSAAMPAAPAVARGRPMAEAVAAGAFGLDDPSRVAVTPGAELALRLLPHLLGAGTAWIDGPTYASHADAWSRAGVRLVASKAEADVVVVVNPNNPDGRILDHGALRDLADRLAARNGWLVVDESFADVLPGASIALLGHPRIVALRSFGKFYGLAGLRLGLVLAAPDVVRRVREWQGDWPISADAIAAGAAAYADPVWALRTRARLTKAAERLDAALRHGGFEIIGGTALFRLTKAKDAPDRFAALCAQGVLARPFAAEPSWLRFGLPHPSVFQRAEAALSAFAPRA